MKEFWNTIQLIFTAVGGWLGYFLGGCDGNLKGISKLLVGMEIDEAVRRMEGIECGFKKTSCPDQIAKALKAFRAEHA